MKSPACDCCELLYWQDPDDDLSSGLVKANKDKLDDETTDLIPIRYPGSGDSIVSLVVHRDELRELTDEEIDYYEKAYGPIRTMPDELTPPRSLAEMLERQLGIPPE